MDLSKRVPLWIKCPLSVLLSEMGKVPYSVVCAHMRKAYADAKPLGEAKRMLAQQECHAEVYAYLDKKYGDMLDEAAVKYREGIYRSDFPIWMLWWQGEKNAPPLVRACINSVRKHAGDHPVYVLDADNYGDFVDLPEHILSKVQNGTISLTHFSDIIRMNLIAQHGGLWLDATIFCTRDISGAQFERPVFTIRNPGGDLWNISRWEWSGFAIYGRKGGPLFCMMCDLFNAYWKDHNVLIEYFLIDCAMRLVYDRNSYVRGVIDRIPANNSNLYYFQQHFGDSVDEICDDWTTEQETWLYKLTWKAKYPLETPDGKKTLYARWLEVCGIERMM